MAFPADRPSAGGFDRPHGRVAEPYQQFVKLLE
jgi:hypothetical protein